MKRRVVGTLMAVAMASASSLVWAKSEHADDHPKSSKKEYEYSKQQKYTKQKEYRDEHHSSPAVGSSGKSLPPGLQKNAERGKPLPPGWQKKLRKGDTLGDDIYHRGQVVVPLGKDGSISIKVDNTIIRMMDKTRRILDIIEN
ncbi:hypothetical protein [Thiomicrorhabdus heinhorstiae]|uniref:RcnB family protein n=1 Tax=Thiomicrorhabdus heinhorstiae TaxID=2748010 RepID=A0ABS0BUZ8_9GAMM|nr:hypothetical protein [Thiomicrorhabdus heinhorstiae]MBF6057660.1 hypothetical protein [Thiomicrorhabdus heinhorstiae]